MARESQYLASSFCHLFCFFCVLLFFTFTFFFFKIRISPYLCLFDCASSKLKPSVPHQIAPRREINLKFIAPLLWVTSNKYSGTRLNHSTNRICGISLNSFTLTCKRLFLFRKARQLGLTIR